jgi:hypothetical protein
LIAGRMPAANSPSSSRMCLHGGRCKHE